MKAILAFLDYQHYRPDGLLKSLHLLHRICAAAEVDANKRTVRVVASRTSAWQAARTAGHAQVNCAKLHNKLAGDCKPQLGQAILAAAGWKHQVANMAKSWVWTPSAEHSPLRCIMRP